MGPHGYEPKLISAPGLVRPLTCTDVKFNNIVLDYRKDAEDQVHIGRVNLADPESAAKLEEGHAITGIQVGNVMWRSPEAQAGIRIGKASDVFSFGIVVSIPTPFASLNSGPTLIERWYAVHQRRSWN